jgi:NADH:ubiquinone reductase (H+-translocating)
VGARRLRRRPRLGRGQRRIGRPTAEHAYRHAPVGSVASLGLHRGVAEVYGMRMRGFPAWLTHRSYHLLKLPTMNRRLRVVSDWTLALLFRREVVPLDVLEHPREEFETALRAVAGPALTGPGAVLPRSRPRASGRELSRADRR